MAREECSCNEVASRESLFALDLCGDCASSGDADRQMPPNHPVFNLTLEHSIRVPQNTSGTATSTAFASLVPEEKYAMAMEWQLVNSAQE
jgi:hypothetical protein